MKRSFFRSSNFIKILAVFLSLAFWLFVSGERPRVLAERHTFTNIPVDVRGLGDNLVVMDMPESVTLTLQGPLEAIAGLSPPDLEVYVDLVGKGAGEHRLRVIGEPPPGLTIVSFDPGRIDILIEELLAQQMTVEPELTGFPADGLITGEPQFMPDQVFVKGAASLLHRVDKVSFSVNVSNAVQDIEARLPLKAISALGEPIDGLAISPSFADVKVPIIYPSKEVLVEPAFIGEPSPGFLLHDYLIRPSRIIITGADYLLYDINTLYTEEIDITEFTGEFTKDVAIITPLGVEIQGEPYASVSAVILPEEIPGQTP